MVVSNAFEIELSNDTKLVASKTLEANLEENSLERGPTRYYYAIFLSEAFEAKSATSAFLDPFFQQQVLIFYRMAQKLLFALS